ACHVRPQERTLVQSEERKQPLRGRRQRDRLFTESQLERVEQRERDAWGRLRVLRACDGGAHRRAPGARSNVIRPPNSNLPSVTSLRRRTYRPGGGTSTGSPR